MKKITLLILVCAIMSPLVVTAATDTSEDVSPTVIVKPKKVDKDLEDELAYLRAEGAAFKEYMIKTASKVDESIYKTTSTVSVITQEQISAMGARNLLDVLKLVPGFGITQTRYGMRQIEVRGVSTGVSEKVLFMLNGHPLDHNLINAGSILNYDDLPVDTIKRLEIIRGPGSALYGANAFLAVINIITQNAIDLNGFHASAGGGSFGTKQLRASWGKRFDNSFEAALHFNFADTNGIESPLRTSITDPTIGKSQLTEKRYDFEWQLSYKDFKFEGRYIDKQMGTFFGAVGTLEDNRIHQIPVDYFLKLSRKWTIADKFSVDTQVFYDDFVTETNWTYATSFFGHSVVPNKRTGGEIQANYAFSDNQNLIAGFSYAKEVQNNIISVAGFDPDRLTMPFPFTSNKSRSRWGVYAQDVWDPFKNLHITLGSRYDRYNDFGGTFNPRAGFNWEFIENYSLKFSYGTAYRAPSFGELTYTNPVSLGNPTLQPEKVRTFEGGLIAHPVTGLTTQATYYYTNIDKIISLVPQPGQSAIPYKNSGKITAQGVEGEIRYDFESLKGSYLSANSVWQHSIQNGRQLADVPRYRTNIMANWAIDKTWSAFSHVLVKSNTSRNLGDTRAAVPGYALVDLGLVGKNIFNQKIDLGFNIYNLFDKRYYDPAPYSATPGQDLSFVGDFQMAGIAYFGHISLHF